MNIEMLVSSLHRTRNLLCGDDSPSNTIQIPKYWLLQFHSDH